MNKTERKKPGGDKVISRLRILGDVLESTSIKLFVAATVTTTITVGVRLLTDWRVSHNKKKMSNLRKEK
jgi:hypothetical protein